MIGQLEIVYSQVFAILEVHEMTRICELLFVNMCSIIVIILGRLHMIGDMKQRVLKF